MKAFESGAHLRGDLKRYFAWYNTERPHQGLDDATPDEVYFSQPLIQAA
ncbi:integrase core domain-containing protein [Cobetia amphilecti]